MRPGQARQEEIYHMVLEHPELIGSIPDISEENILVALEQDGTVIRCLRNPTEKQMLWACESDCEAALHMANPPYGSIRNLVRKKRFDILKRVRNIPEEAWEFLLAECPEAAVECEGLPMRVRVLAKMRVTV